MNTDPQKSAQSCGCDPGHAAYRCGVWPLCAWGKAESAIIQTTPVVLEPHNAFVVKDEGNKLISPSGVSRNVVEAKTDYMNIIHGPMFDRWAEHLSKAKTIYPDVALGKPNWTQAKSAEDLLRFRTSAFRHFRQWLRGDMDEDHAAAVFWNIDGAEYTKQQMKTDALVP